MEPAPHGRGARRAARCGGLRRKEPTMRRVLCAVDESREAAVAIDVAASLADRLGEPLVLVHVLPHAAEGFRAGGDGPIVCAVDGSEEAEAGAVVAARAAERLGRELILTHVLQTGTMLDEAAAREGTVLLQA